jgi:hypothetical protein
MILLITAIILAVVGVVGVGFKLFLDWNEKIREIDNIFSSDEMRKGMMNLRHFVDDNQSNFEDVFRELLDKRDQKGNEISLDSGHFFHPFRKKTFQ